MTLEIKRMLIARKCGWDIYYVVFNQWEATYGYNPKTDRAAIEGRGATPELTMDNAGVPDYPNDLNAMAEAEKILTGDQLKQYEDNLIQIFIQHGKLDGRGPWGATAEQRADAFCKVFEGELKL